MNPPTIKQIQSRVIGGSDITVIKEGVERELVDWCWRRYPHISEVPVGNWFIPDLASPIEIIITASLRKNAW